jgi:hypothetical protein
MRLPASGPASSAPDIPYRTGSTLLRGHSDDSPCLDILKATDRSIRPDDLDLGNHGESTKSRMHPMILRRQVARVGPNPSSECSITEFDPNSGPDRRRARTISNVDGQPVSTIRNHVQEKTSGGSEVLDHDILPAVVVEVREDRSSTGSSRRRRDTTGRRHDLKPSAITPEEDVRFGVRIRRVGIVTRTDPSIGGIEVESPIIVEVHEPEPETREVPARRTETGSIRRVEES